MAAAAVVDQVHGAEPGVGRVVVEDDQLVGRARRSASSRPSRSVLAASKVTMTCGRSGIGLRRAEQVGAGQEPQDARDLERPVAERGDDPRPPGAARAQGVRHREHRAERVPVRPHVAGQADLGRPRPGP